MLLLLAFCVTFVIQFYFYSILFRKYTGFNHRIAEVYLPPVSLIICAKNEENHMGSLLQSVVEQKYKNLELVLVDDGSSDSTLDMMYKFQKAYSDHLKNIIVVPVLKSDANGKKKAQSLGIASATHEHLLFTDADCQPVSDHWIEHMMSGFSKQRELVLGYGAYNKIKGDFLNKLIRFETLLTAVQYFSYAIAGKAYMGVGRNMTYKKQLFSGSGGHSGHQHIKSGDDDLFISMVANDRNVGICDHPLSFTTSTPPLRYSDWIRQKRRHITTAPHYRTGTKISLGLFYISQLSFYIIGVIALVTHTYPYVILSLMCFRFILWYRVISQAGNRLNEKDLIAFGPLYEISIIFMQLYIFLKNIISPPKYW